MSTHSVFAVWTNAVDPQTDIAIRRKNHSNEHTTDVDETKHLEPLHASRLSFLKSGLKFPRGFLRAPHVLKVGPLLLIATICHSIARRYTFAMRLVRRNANYSLHHPPRAPQLSPHLPALSQGRKAFHNLIPASG